jgi:hypothetical protein
MSDIFEEIKLHLPPYLSPQQKGELLREIKAFPNIYYYLNFSREEMLQGDGWKGFTVFKFETGEKKKVKAVVLSNTCDIDPANNRVVPPKIVFAPLVKLNKYIQRLQNSRIREEEITAKIEAIKRQEVTSIFYFPANQALDHEEHIAMLDDLHSQPWNVFAPLNKQIKLFTLSQAGFYLFLLKLSIHFCRFNDGVVRYTQ